MSIETPRYLNTDRIAELRRNISFGSYKRALDMYWKGENSRCIEFLTKFVGENPMDDMVVPFYRLWIEILASQDDKTPLAELSRHIRQMTVDDSKRRVSWQALRGLIHLECDEKAGAELYRKVLPRKVEDPYHAEFAFVYALRNGHTKNLEIMTRFDSGFADYFHWIRISDSVLEKSEIMEIEPVLRMITRFYELSPYPHLIRAYRELDEKHYEGAYKHFTRISGEYSTETINILKAQCLIPQEKYGKAIEILRNLVSNVDTVNPDIPTLLAYASAEAAKGSRSADAYTDCESWLNLAEQRLQQTGRPASFVSHQRATLEEYRRKSVTGYKVDVSNMEPANFWLVKLTPGETFDLMERQADDAEFIYRAMGNQVKPGDLVFFASDNRRPGLSGTNIVAVYNIFSKPVWHPINGYECSLEVVYRLKHALNLDVEIVDEDESTGTLPSGHPFKYGVYSLEGGAMDIISNTIQIRNEEGSLDTKFGKIFDKISV